MWRLLAVFFFVSISFVSFSQRPSERVIDSIKYRSNTSWSCSDKYFGYTFLSYAMPLAFEKSVENPFKSRQWAVGYVYRYKIIQKLDLGFELGLANRKSFIKKESLRVFDETNHFNLIYTYHHYLSTSFFFRFNLAGQSFSSLGTFLDLGLSYQYAYSYGNSYKHKSKYLDEKSKFKRPEYMSPHVYGPFVRIGYNHISMIVSYDFNEWIRNYGSENLNYNSGNLLLGLQLNLYSR